MTDRPENGEFADPLENYDPPAYDDPLERAIAEEPVTNIRTSPWIGISPETTVETATGRLAGRQVACLLVEEEGRLVGVFSDRDVLNRAALEWPEVKDRPVREVMSTDPVFVRDDDNAAAVLCVMAASGYRHVPVLDYDDRIVGVITPQRLTGFLRERMSG